MPLLKGKSQSIIGENVKTLRNEGKDEAQAVAIAMSHAGMSKSKLDKKAKKVANKKPKISSKPEFNR